LAVVRGAATRVLLADEVGLGKTIQAGLIVAELQARGLVDRVLIVTPAGLRDQWRSELQNRFGVEAAVAGLAELRQRTATLPVGLNPWTTVPVAIASVDYIKRAEILQSVRSCRWDLVILDEAHGVTVGSDRFAAVSAIAERSLYVVLLTATPHHGDSHAFAALCNVGARNDSLLVFRRTRAQVLLGTGRHVHTLRVRSTMAETRMFALLAAFAAAVRAEHDSPDAWLALSVLHKRAFSSARALALTVERRLASLATDRDQLAQQLALPWSDLGGEIDGADEPPDVLETVALADAAHERRLLDALLNAAQSAARQESKIGVIRRLLRRTAESVLLFTEFRDTLRHLRDAIDEPVAILHGGLTRVERGAALDDFVSGRRRILVTTDAAGEGLNLHHRCRTVVNLELPWNPTRLEQRIGRVDRIGQSRRVEVFHLVGRDTGEERVLERLKARIASAATDIDAVNPIEDERLAARWVITRHANEAAAQPPPQPKPAPEFASDRIVVDLREAARAEAIRLTEARARSTTDDERLLAALDTSGPWIARTRLRETRRRLGPRAVAIVRIDDSHGPLSETSLVAMTFTIGSRALECSRRNRALPAGVITQLNLMAEHALPRVQDERTAHVGHCIATHLARRRRIIETLAVRPSPVQPGLFDRRAERDQATERAGFDEAIDDQRRPFDPVAWLEAKSERRARLLLVLVP
jgi:superfamily II DNA or RNA helicase